MKLVELLARELAAWPAGLLGNDGITQDRTGEINTLDSGCTPKFYEGDGVWLASSHSFLEGYEPMKRASDYKTAIVTREMWQAERDRQKGGEWKRHRGMKQPVPDGAIVEVKLRCGDIQKSEAKDFIWSYGYCDIDANIMKYRVISQPQQEDGLELVQGAQDAVISCIAHNFEVGKITHGPIMMGDEVVGEASPEWNQQAKWDQIDGPLRWRDEVTELNAYIEKYTRERDALIERLASEGFALIPPVVSVVSEFSGVDMSDWRNWKAGDIVVCVEDYNKQFTQGKKYVLSRLDKDERYPRVQIESDDMGEGNVWGVEQFKFHRRP